MLAIVAVLTGALAALGVLLIIAGARRRTVLPRPTVKTSTFSAQQTLVMVTLATLAALTVYALTGWYPLTVLVFATVLMSRKLLSERNRLAIELERDAAVATWTELVRDNTSGAAGLEQAVVVAAAHAPAAIAPEMSRFERRLNRRPLPDCLVLLGRDLNNRAGDLVIAALLQASQHEARELGPLLGRLSLAIREDVRMQQRVEVGRTRIRTSARIVVLVTVVTVALLTVIAPQIVKVYSTPMGQVWLSVVLAVFIMAGWMMRRLGRSDDTARFQLRSPS